MDEIFKHLAKVNADKSCSDNLGNNYDKALELEQESIIDISPSRVENSESIARLIIHPIHIDENGDVLPEAFRDASTFGMSTNRKRYMSTVEIHQAGEQKAERDRIRKPEKKYSGFVDCVVEQIRNYKENGKQVFTVYDTAIEENKYHSDVFLVLHGKKKTDNGEVSPKSAKKLRLKDLSLMFSKINKV